MSYKIFQIGVDLDFQFANGLNINDNLNVTGNLDCDGTITGSGIDTDLLDKANKWTGLNTFQDTLTLDAAATINYGDGLKGLGTKSQVDTTTADLNNGLLTDAQTLTGDIVFNTAVPSGLSVGDNPPDNQFITYSDVGDVLAGSYSILDTEDNTWTGTNVFNTNCPEYSGSDAVSDASDNQAVTKVYVDDLITAASKTITKVFDTPGTYVLENTSNFDKAVSIDFTLFSGGFQSGSYNQAGACISASIGNALGDKGSALTIVIGGGADTTTTTPITNTISMSGTTLYLVSTPYVDSDGSTINPGAVGYYNNISCSQAPAFEVGQQESDAWTSGNLYNAFTTSNGVRLGYADSTSGGIVATFTIDGGYDV